MILPQSNNQPSNSNQTKTDLVIPIILPDTFSYSPVLCHFTCPQSWFNNYSLNFIRCTSTNCQNKNDKTKPKKRKKKEKDCNETLTFPPSVSLTKPEKEHTTKEKPTCGDKNESKKTKT